jgi:hypothetical protein
MANPTTNYGFVLPTSSDLVTDLPADFDVALQGVDTRLKALNPETTLGDIAYRSATANTNTRLGIGSTGNVLTVSGGVPVWAAPAGGGKVLQVVSAVTTTQTSIATTALTDTTVTATITPTSATSKILVLICAEYFLNRTAAFIGGAAAVLRGATTIVNYPAETNPFINAGGASTISLGDLMSIIYLDSPATTSATTYKLQAAVERTANSASTTFQYSSAPSTITLLEIGA